MAIKKAQDPFLDAGMRGYIEKFARDNYWRAPSWYRLSDLVQDGYLCYAKCKARYEFMQHPEPTKEELRHAMALVKTAFYNHVMDVAKSKMQLDERALSELAPPEGSDEAFMERLLQPEQESASIVALLADAPAEIKQLFQMLAGDGKELLGFQRRRVGRRLMRETNNERFCRLLGLDPQQVDMIGQIQAYFGFGM